LIAAFGAAVKALPQAEKTLKYVTELKNYCVEKLKGFENTAVNSPENGLCYILNFSFMGYRSETLLHHLEKYGICVSSGSACSKGKGSYVLREMGLPQNRVDSALRISFGRDNTKEDIDALISGLESALALKKAQN
jgi:cysteine desulfurase